jgi:hypothetical protein
MITAARLASASRQMSDDQLYEAWDHALRLQKNEKFTEARPLLAMLFELLGHAIADRENILSGQRPSHMKNGGLATSWK